MINHTANECIKHMRIQTRRKKKEIKTQEGRNFSMIITRSIALAQVVDGLLDREGSCVRGTKTDLIDGVSLCIE